MKNMFGQGFVNKKSFDLNHEVVILFSRKGSRGWGEVIQDNTDSGNIKEAFMVYKLFQA